MLRRLVLHLFGCFIGQLCTRKVGQPVTRQHASFSPDHHVSQLFRQGFRLVAGIIQNLLLGGTDQQRFNFVVLSQPEGACPLLQLLLLWQPVVQLPGIFCRGLGLADTAALISYLLITRLQQGFDRLQQSIGISGQFAQCLGHDRRQCVAPAAPVVTCHLGQQFAVILLQLLAEQAAGIKSVLGEHALAPAVDGVYRGFIHPLSGLFQFAGSQRSCLFHGKLGLGEQLLQERIRRGLTTKYARGIGQASADSVTQFTGGCIGEGHHQNLRR